MRKALESSVLNRERDIYRIKAYEDVKINLIILNGFFIITLFNVAYVSDYLTNIVVIGRFSRGGVYWSSSTPDIFIYGGEVFVNLEVVG